MRISILSLGRTGPNRIGNWLRANLAGRRSRLLLATLGLVLATGGLTVLDVRNSEISRDLTERQRQLARLEQLGQTDLWQQRRAETDLARVQAEVRLWDAETDG